MIIYIYSGGSRGDVSGGILGSCGLLGSRRFYATLWRISSANSKHYVSPVGTLSNVFAVLCPSYIKRSGSQRPTLCPRSLYPDVSDLSW